MSYSENSYEVYVNDSRIYAGNFQEVPDRFRDDILEALDEWGTVLAKSGLNEMLYSLLAWYEEKIYLCENCNKEFDDETQFCTSCGESVKSRYKYERDENLTRIIMCIGMITHVDIKS